MSETADYGAIVDSIANIIAKTRQPLTETQRVAMAGAVAIYLDQANRRPDPAPVGVRVPDVKVHPEASRDYLQEAYVDGWNECREEALRLAAGNTSAAMHALTLLLEGHDRWLSEGVIASVPGTRTEIARQAAMAVLEGNPQPGAVVGEKELRSLRQLDNRTTMDADGMTDLGAQCIASQPALQKAIRTLTNTDKGVA